MSFPEQRQENNAVVYQPSAFTKILLMLTLVLATFAIPYSLLSQPSSESIGAEENGETPTENTNVDDPGVVDTSGVVPSMLTFDSDSSIPNSASLSLATPYESGWDVTSQDESVTVYDYPKANCEITTRVIDIEISATSKDASLTVLAYALGDEVLASGSQISVNEISYNFTSTAQVLGVGSITSSGMYEWTYARGLSTINKGVLITASCDTKDDMYVASDNLRSQFGILLSP